MNSEKFNLCADPSGSKNNNDYDEEPAGKVLPRSSKNFKNWLTNPVRKLSQFNKNGCSSSLSSHRLPVERAFSSSTEIKSFLSPGSKLTASDSIPEGTTISVLQSSSSDESAKNNSIITLGTAALEEDCDIGELELPPPIPIQEYSYQVIIANPDTTVLSVSDEKIESQPIEAFVKNSGLDESFNDFSLVTASNNNGDVSDSSNENTYQLSKVEKAFEKRGFVLQELIQTERDYVQNLGMIAHGYMATLASADYESNHFDLAQADENGIATLKNCDNSITVPDDLKGGKEKIIFGNLLNIYRFHMDTFCPEIEKCGEEPELLGGIFRKHERRLNMYVAYCQNKTKSECIVSEYLGTLLEQMRQKLGHKLQLPDLLIMPIQRIMKYELLLRDILECTEKAALESEAVDLRKAVEIMHVVPKTANDMMMVSRLQGFETRAQGKLLQQGQLLVADVSSSSGVIPVKYKTRQVFLFEKIILFSKAVGQNTQFSNPNYIYKNHLQVNKMTLDGESNSGKFMLKSKHSHQEHLAVLCEGFTREDTAEWIGNIQAILDTQLDFLRALQSPITFQKELTKEIYAPELNSMWNSTMRKTLSHPSQVNKDLEGEYASATRESITPTEPRPLSQPTFASTATGNGLVSSKPLRIVRKISAGLTPKTSVNSLLDPKPSLEKSKKPDAPINNLVEPSHQQRRHSSDARSSSRTVAGRAQTSPSNLEKSIIDGLKIFFCREKNHMSTKTNGNSENNTNN